MSNINDQQKIQEKNEISDMAKMLIENYTLAYEEIVDRKQTLKKLEIIFPEFNLGNLLLRYFRHLKMYWVLLYIWIQQKFSLDPINNRSLALQTLHNIIQIDHYEIEQYLIYMNIDQNPDTPNIKLYNLVSQFIINNFNVRNFSFIERSQEFITLVNSSSTSSIIYEIYEKRNVSNISSEYLTIQNEFLQTILLSLIVPQNVCHSTVSPTFAGASALRCDTIILVGQNIFIKQQQQEQQQEQQQKEKQEQEQEPESEPFLYSGYATLYRYPEYHPELDLDTVYIDVICTMSGYGTSLIHTIIDYATVNNYAHVNLSALAYVINYYRRLGFRLSEDQTCMEPEDVATLADRVSNLRFRTSTEALENPDYVTFLQSLVDNHIVHDKACTSVEECSQTGYSMTFCTNTTNIPLNFNTTTLLSPSAPPLE